MKTHQKIYSMIVSVSIIFGVCSPSFAEGFRKYPYLQNVTPNEITICWEIEEQDDTTHPEHYRVEYGIGAYSEVVSYPGAYPTDPRLFQLTLTGLQPGTLYQYRVKSGSVWSGESTFLTALDSDQPFTFAVYADPQPLLSNAPWANDDRKDVVNLLNSYSASLNFVMCAGDLWHSNEDRVVDIFFEITKDLMNHIPLFPALGNHEYWKSRNSSGSEPLIEPEQYRKYFVLPTNLTSTEDYYSFDYGNAHFLVVNTNREESLAVGGTDYRLGSPQYTAIQRDLISASGTPGIVHIFAAMHMPAHSNSQDGGGVVRDPGISKYLGELFQTYGVDIVFAGHDHHYERFQPVDSHHQPISLCEPPGDPTDPDHPCNMIHEGVIYVVTGGGGGSLIGNLGTGGGVDDSGTIEDCPKYDPDCKLPIPPLTSIIAESVHHAMFISVHGEQVHVEVKRTDGSMVDQFIIDKERR